MLIGRALSIPIILILITLNGDQRVIHSINLVTGYRFMYGRYRNDQCLDLVPTVQGLMEAVTIPLYASSIYIGYAHVAH